MHIRQKIFYLLTTPFALLMGGCFCLASYLCYLNAGNVFNNLTLDRTITLLFIAGLYMRIRRYRDSIAQQGFISYGKALITGIWISALSAGVYSIYTVILYSLHPGLLSHYITTIQKVSSEVYGNSPMSGMMNQYISAFATPFFVGLSELFGKFVNGLFYSLIVAAFLRRKQPDPIA